MLEQRVAVRLSDEADFAGFRRGARACLARGIAPERVQWRVENRVEVDFFDDGKEVSGEDEPVANTARARVPPDFLSLCETVVLHADVDRFALLYRLLWRLVHEPLLRHDPLDADRLAAETMARAVRRDKHKMTAFVRFRPLADPTQPDGVQHVAWFEPTHHIVDATAPFFARRFAQMQWAILTPERCVRWDGHALTFGPGAKREDAPPADADEHLWLTYYASIFNPARLKLAMMRKEMPRRYWKNLPEAVLIHSLAASAQERSGRMVEQQAAEPVRRRPAASASLAIAARPVGVHAAGSLAALRDATQRCRDCPIGAHATQAVNGEGDEHASLMIVGEQAGDREDLAGRPFVGPAGQLLERAFERLGWSRDKIFLTNVVRHFKFELSGKRRIHKTPAQQEIAACLHWLESEIALVRPQSAIALGATAARALLGRAVSPVKEHGTWFTRPDGLRVLVTLHPSALLRMPADAQGAAFTQWVADLGLASP